MKYFTADWYSGNLSDEECIRLRDAYWEYIGSIYDELPFGIKMLAKQINLHDSKIKKFDFAKNNKALDLEIIAGDLPIGYFSLQIHYTGVIKYWRSETKNKNVICVEILSNEIELLGNNMFCQRILFVDKSEAEILFKDLSINIFTETFENFKSVHRNIKKSSYSCLSKDQYCNMLITN